MPIILSRVGRLISNHISILLFHHGCCTKAVARDEHKQEFDCSTIAVGMTVTHAKFGKGEIVNIDKARKYIRVSCAVG